MTPEEYEKQQNDITNATINNLRQRIDRLSAESKKINNQSYKHLIPLWLGGVTLFFGFEGIGGLIQGIGTNNYALITTALVFIAVVVLCWGIHIKHYTQYKTRLPEISKQISNYNQLISNENDKMNKKINQYKEEYTKYHSQRLALDMASSPAVKAVSGQLGLLFRQAIDSADRNSYIQTIEIIMNLSINAYQVCYNFSQKGTVSPMHKKGSSFTFQEFGAKNLDKVQEQNGATQAISSAIQASLLEHYIDGNNIPSVSIEKGHTIDIYSGKMYDAENVCNIIFRQENKNYEGEKSWT